LEEWRRVWGRGEWSGPEPYLLVFNGGVDRDDLESTGEAKAVHGVVISTHHE